MNPKAVEFQPSSHAGSPSDISKPTVKKSEAEDGEIEDGAAAKIVKVEQQVSSGQVSQKAENGSQRAENSLLKEESVKAVGEPELKRTALASPTPTNAGSQSASDKRQPLASSTSHPPPFAATEASYRSSPNGGMSRPLHELPSRPDPASIRAGDFRTHNRHGDRMVPPRARESRLSDRLPFDGSKDADRGFDRPDLSQQMRSSERQDANFRHDDRGRLERYPADIPSGARNAGDERHMHPMHGDAKRVHRDDRPPSSSDSRFMADTVHGRREFSSVGLQEEDNSMLPPRSTPSQHPDRAALIHGSQESGRPSAPSRSSDRRVDQAKYGDYPPSEHTSGVPSPAQTQERAPAYDGRRSDRRYDDAKREFDDSRNPRSRYDDPNTPTGPRTERSGPMASNSLGERYRENLKPTYTSSSNYDMNHGRLNQDYNRASWQGEPGRGRHSTDNEAPPGPRLSNGSVQHQGRGGRSSLPSPSHMHPKTVTPSPAPPNLSQPQTKQSLNGPMTRGGPRDANHTRQPSFESPPVQPSANESDAPAIHPDRLRAIQGSSGPQNHVGAERTDPGRFPRNPPPLNTTSVASSRGPISGPNQLSPPGRPGSSPSGPGSMLDRNRDKRFEVLQNTLQLSNGPSNFDRSGSGTIIRGRGGRGPPTPSALAQPTAPPAPKDAGPARDDLFAGRANGPVPSGHVENDAGFSRGRRELGGREAPSDMERRSYRHCSRSPRPDRSLDMPPSQYRERDRPPVREPSGDRFRDESSFYETRNSVATERNMRNTGGAFDREQRGPPPLRRSARDGRTHDRGGTEGGYERRGEDYRDNGGSLRKRGRAGEEMGERSMDNKRPRRL